MLNPGDEVIIFSPYWVSYLEIVKMTGAIPVIVHANLDQDFKPNTGQLEKAITDRTRLLIFSSPCNPTGSVFTQEELEEMAEVLSEHEQVFVVSDEIYEYINFTEHHASIGAIPSIADRVITVNGFSKGFAMTGWRLGYMGAPAWLAEACTKIQGQFTSGAAAFSQRAAIRALEADRSETEAMCELFLRRRDLIIKELSEVPGVKLNKPLGAFYIFPDVSAHFGKSFEGSSINNADDMALFLLEQAHVATVSGAAFGADECIRISYAASDHDIIEACSRIGRAISALE
jgi:aspartate aminotransferase